MTQLVTRQVKRQSDTPKAASVETAPRPSLRERLRPGTLARKVLPTAAFRTLEKIRTSRRLSRGERLVPEKELKRVYRQAVHYLTDRLESGATMGDYLEFGVYTGTSLACMHDTLNDLNVEGMRMIGFDSFEGLPAGSENDDDGAWYVGQFASSIRTTRSFLNKRGVDWDRVHLVKGWFSDTAVPETAERLGIRKASVVLIDSDTYTSCHEALAFVEPLIVDECVVFFDDWNSLNLAERNMGERKAFEEFLADHPHFEIEPFDAYNDNSKAFVLRRMRHARSAEVDLDGGLAGQGTGPVRRAVSAKVSAGVGGAVGVATEGAAELLILLPMFA